MDEYTESVRATIAVAAKAAHNTTRCYCQAIGDDSQPVWDDAPTWQRESAIAGVEAIFRNPRLAPADSHNLWWDQKLRHGWTWGHEKDPEKKTHPCMLPYRELPPALRAKDVIFGAVVRGVLGFDQ